MKQVCQELQKPEQMEWQEASVRLQEVVQPKMQRQMQIMEVVRRIEACLRQQVQTEAAQMALEIQQIMPEIHRQRER